MVLKNEKGWRGVNDKYYGSPQEAQQSFAAKFGWAPPVKPKVFRPLKAFLSHVHEDKPEVLKLYEKLGSYGIEPWIDRKSLVGGTLWKREIRDAIVDTVAFIVCLSSKALTIRGYFRVEIKEAIAVAESQPKGSNFLIPIKLEECKVPTVLRQLHCISYFESDGFSQLKKALQELERWIGSTQ